MLPVVFCMICNKPFWSTDPPESKMCAECENHSELFLAVVAVKNDPEPNSKLSEIERTGEIIWLDRNVVEQIFDSKIEEPFIFANPQLIQTIHELYRAAGNTGEKNE